MVDDFYLELQRTPGRDGSHGHSGEKWSPSPTGYLMINWDAAIGLQRTGIGIVIRDEAGGFVAAKTKTFPFLVVLL
jgi:hypothetical protein